MHCDLDLLLCDVHLFIFGWVVRQDGNKKEYVKSAPDYALDVVNKVGGFARVR